MFLADRAPLVRSRDDRIVAGVAAGLADHLGVAAAWVRLAFVLTAVVGIGVVLYVAGWLLMPSEPGEPASVERFVPHDIVDYLALAAVAIGLSQLLRVGDVSLPARLLAPLLIAAAGLAVLFLWPRGNEPIASAELPEWVPSAAAEAIGVLGTRRGLLVRAMAGAVLLIGGLAALLGATNSWTALREGFVAVVVMTLGFLLVFGPWLWRLSSALVDERRAGIRATERAEMGAHLHDSVLQTLAMVQRRADDPREVVRLARKQERELRSWLLSGQPTEDAAIRNSDSVGSSLDAIAAELEEIHGVPVEVVRVRDCKVDERIGAMLLAAREAIVNAQRHSTATTVSVYCEVSATEVTVFVRDRGSGFDRDTVGADRRGLDESIEGRMQRHGGRSTIRSSPGSGTEVELVMPRSGGDA